MVDKIKNHELKQYYEIKLHPFEWLYCSMFMDIDIKLRYEGSAEGEDLLYYFIEGDTLYYFTRITTKKILMIKGKECLKAIAFKRLQDGSYMQVYTSYYEPDFPIGTIYDRITIHRAGIFFTPTKNKAIDEPDKDIYNVTLYQYFYPSANLSVRIFKGFMASYFKKQMNNQFIEFKNYILKNKINWPEDLKEYAKLDET